MNSDSRPLRIIILFLAAVVIILLQFVPSQSYSLETYGPEASSAISSRKLTEVRFSKFEGAVNTTRFGRHISFCHGKSDIFFSKEINPQLAWNICIALEELQVVSPHAPASFGFGMEGDKYYLSVYINREDIESGRHDSEFQKISNALSQLVLNEKKLQIRLCTSPFIPVKTISSM